MKLGAVTPAYLDPVSCILQGSAGLPPLQLVPCSTRTPDTETRTSQIILTNIGIYKVNHYLVYI